MRPLVQKTPAQANENFEQAVQPYLKDLKNYCRSLMKSTWDGEDLMQETLAKAYKSWLKTPKPVSKAYLFRIASNTWIDGYRKRKPNEDFNQDLSEMTADKETDSDAVYKAMEILLHELSPKQRVATLLSVGLGYTAKETAEIIDTSEGAVKAALHRARTRLNRMEDNVDFNLEHDKVTTYVTAFREGKPEKLVDLFQEENLEPQMSASNIHAVSGSRMAIQEISRSGVSYVLVRIQMRNGGQLFIPFYRSEWLSSMLGLTKEFSFAA